MRTPNANTSRENTISVTIESLATGGSCVGVITQPVEMAGKKAFVRGAIPGETVEAEITYSKKKFVEANTVSIEQKSPERIDPTCKVFGECGGCDLQHINLSAQRGFKVDMVRDLLRVHGGITPAEDVSQLDNSLPGYTYRRRMSFHLNKKAEFGLYRKHGRSIVEITSCPISTEPINRVLSERLDLIKGCAPEIETVTIEDHDGEIFLALEVHPRNESAMDTLSEKVAFKELCKLYPNTQVNYRHKPIFRARPVDPDGPPVGHFSQNNKLANDVMIQYLIEHSATDQITDLYAGAGNISIPLALSGKTVTAVEVNPHLVAFGEVRAKEAGVSSRLTFHQQSCEKWAEKHSAGATVVLDPPRSGALEVCKRLSPSISSKLLYVSCYPPTFARDVQVLEERGYELQSVKVLDMFPQTYHSELIGILTARTS